MSKKIIGITVGTPTKPQKIIDEVLEDWAKQPTKPAYTASEVGADATGTAAAKVSEHNTSEASHNDIRLLVAELTSRLNALANSDDTTLDQMAEVVSYIKNNKSLIDGITTSKVNVSDIIDNLTTSVSNKPLSAKQGVALKALIDAIIVPTKLSQLSGDSTHRVVTDAEKQTWNGKSNFSGNYNDLTNKPTIPSAYTHPTTEGNKHIPSGGSSGQILRWSANGTAVWGDEDKSIPTHNHIYYGVCSTAADTAAKTVTVDNFSLVEGAMVIVKFTNANSVASPTLNVNGTGAKPIYRYGTTTASTGTTTSGWVAGAVQLFIYDGAGWIRDYWYNTTYSNVSLGQGYATCSTAAATTAKTATLSSYALSTGGIVAVKFSNAVPANATLNINSKGAKNIYFRGAKITADIIKAGDVAVFIYSTNYHLISIDRWQNDITSVIGNQAYLRDDVNVLLEEIKNKITMSDIPQADWLQNDITAKDYVKNRTHYSVVEESNILVNDTVKDVVDGAGVYSGRIGLEAGKTYRVYTGAEDGYHDVIALEIESDGVIMGVGLPLPTMNIIEFTEEIATEMGFDVVFEFQDTTVSYDELTFFIFETTETVYKLDKKYLPDEVIGYMDTDNTIVFDNLKNGTYSIYFEDWTGQIDGYEPITVTITDTEKEFLGYIPENNAPINVKRLGVYDSSGKKVGNIRILASYRRTDMGNKLYSFGAISDVHLFSDSTSEPDFQTALLYFNNTEKVAFTCVCGDLTDSGTEYQLGQYKAKAQQYSLNTPVYPITGNHDARANLAVEGVIENHIGHPLYYSFEHADDIFIMVGTGKEKEGQLFTTAELQWLLDTLEENRNKRCFVFNHVRPQDGCGNAYGIYNNDIWGGTEQIVFESLMKHYKNAHQFHGHSHLKLSLQTRDNLANIDKLFGGYSIHIPSLSMPRSGDPSGASSRVELYAESEGYVVDVYKDGIMLRGRDFVEGKFIPQGMFYLDTPLHYIEQGAFVDSTGTVSLVERVNVTNNLTLASNSNPSTKVVKGSSYNANISANTDCNIKSVVVTMGGTDITATVYSNGTINIPSVTGDIVITVVAEGRRPDTTLTWSVGTKIDSSTGAESSSSQYSASNYIEIIDGFTYTLKRTTAGYDSKVCYYDENKNFISCSADSFVSITNGDLEKTIPLISGAKYFRFRAYASGFASGSPAYSSLMSTTITAS